jgi:hypothetical protein
MTPLKLRFEMILVGALLVIMMALVTRPVGGRLW